jgi:hypothetical protein
MGGKNFQLRGSSIDVKQTVFRKIIALLLSAAMAEHCWETFSESAQF